MTGLRRFDQVQLYVLLTESLCRREWYDTVEAVLANGAGAIQLREKGLSDRELLARTRRVRELCDRHGALLIVNDRPDIALLAGADGVHLGQDDLSVRSARRILGNEHVIGISTHTPEQAEAAVRAAPDYIAVGPMFASVTKPQEHIAGPQTLNAVRSLTPLPLVAIGGITVESVHELTAADCLAVCSAIISSTDPGTATADFVRAFRQRFA